MLVVLTTHFVRAKPTKYGQQVKDLLKNPVYCLVQKLNDEVLGINESLDNDNVTIENLIPVLSNLVTSTDECTILVTNKVINNKQDWYITTRPKVSHTPYHDYNTRDIYTTELVGDKHLCGVQMTLNNTFSAGGRCAPIFACIY